MTASVNGVERGQVATNAGWYDFCRWVEELEGVADLRHVTEYGWYEGDLSDVAEQLAVAVEDGEPTPDQQSIADGLREILADAADGVLIIDNGDGPGFQPG